MSTYDTDLDSINNICSLVAEIVELSDEISKETHKVTLKRENIKSMKNLLRVKL